MAYQNHSSQCMHSLSNLNLEFFRGEPNTPGIIGIFIFYSLIFIVGVVSSVVVGRKNKKKRTEITEKESVMLAGRSIGMGVGIFTLTATWVGGGFINGTAEYIFNPGYGLVWCQAPVFYALSLIVNGVLFAKKMRDAGYMTMLDVFHVRFGRVITALLFIPALLGDIFWSGTILAALGATLSVIVGINYVWSVVISAGVSILYTVIGGLYSVAYTDVIQLICIFIGLWLAVPFAMTHDAVANITTTTSRWLGEPITDQWLSYYIDEALLLLFGGIPWQVYYQRVLSQKTGTRAMVLSVVAGVCVLIMSIPAVLLGAIAASTDWNATAYREFGEIPVPACDYPLALPMVMRFLTPTAVGVIGLGAVSAAVMSSTDSSVLSSSSMFAHNVYAPIRDAIGQSIGKDKASDREVLVVMRVAVVFVGAAATLTAVTATSIYGLFVVCSDLLYVVVFPQLVTAVHAPTRVNSYGALAGIVFSLVLRFLGGDPYLSIPPVIKYPWFDEEAQTQMFPHKTMIVIITFLVTFVVSWLADRCSNNASCQALDGRTLAVYADVTEYTLNDAEFTPNDAKCTSNDAKFTLKELDSVGDGHGVVNRGFINNTDKPSRVNGDI